MKPAIAPEKSYRFQVYSFTEEIPAWPLLTYQGVLLRMDVCLWEESPGSELTLSVAERVNSAMRQADIIAATTGQPVAVVTQPLFERHPRVGYIATPKGRALNFDATRDLLLLAAEGGAS